MKIHIQKLHPNIPTPTYANIGDSCVDLFATEEIVIHPQQTVLIKTGIKIAVPQGYEAQVRSRSGIALNTPLRIANGIGTIDSNYRGEVCVIMHNTSELGLKREFYITQKDNFMGVYIIRPGDKIAQLAVTKVEQIEFEEVEDVSIIGNDRHGGFGSTGYTIGYQK